MARAWRLVGRDTELALLEELYERGGVSGVVIAGSAGVGKSRLAAEFVATVETSGARVVRATATRSTASIPFGAFATFVPPTLDGGESRLAVLRRVAESVATESGGRPLVLLVDDGHELDDGSAALLLHLAGTRQAFVVVTLRSGTRAPDAVTALWKEGIAERIDLPELAESEIASLSAEMLGGHLHRQAFDRLWRWTGGNPLYLREVVLAGHERGALVEDQGVWRWSGPLPQHDRLVAVVDSRIGDIPAEQLHVLEVLALAEPIDVRALTAITSEQAVEAVERRELILVERVEQGSGGELVARPFHPLYSEVLRAAMPAVRAQQVRRAIADAVVALGPLSGHDLLRVAGWRLDAGQLDAHLLLAAAQHAMVVAEHELAGRFASAAGEAGAGSPAALVRADACFWQGRHAEAESTVASIDPQSADPEFRMRVAMLHSSVLFWGLGRADDAARVVEDAIGQLGVDRLRNQLTAHRAQLEVFAGRVGDARADAERLLDGDQDPDVVRGALATAIIAWGLQGDVSRAATAADEHVPLALSGDDPSRVGEYLIGKCTAQVLAGQFDAAEEVADAAYAFSVADRAVDYAGVWQLLRGRILLMRGRPASAVTTLADADELLRQHDIVSLRPWALALLATSHATLGDTAAAERALIACDEAINPAVRLYDCDIGLARAWVAAARGEVSHARRLAAATAESAAESGVLLGAVAAWIDVARLGDAAIAASALDALAMQVQGPLAGAGARYAEGVAADDPDAILRASDEFERLGADLLAAEAATQAADTYRRRGLRGSHLQATARAHAMLAGCEGADTPVVGALTEPAEFATLTHREREVVDLVRRGLTNREIASHLWLSVRTVGNHLNHVYAKLGVADRDGLREVAPLIGEADDGKK